MSDSYRYSTLTLYKDSKILPEKHFIVGNIGTYLATLTFLLIGEFQYLRNTLDLTIKIHKSEDFAKAINTNNYNYLKVRQDSRDYYYFVIKKTQTAEETITLELRMDVLNTFPYNNYNLGYQITNKTKVLREHKPRFYLESQDLDVEGEIVGGNWDAQSGDRFILTINGVDHHGELLDVQDDYLQVYFDDRFSYDEEPLYTLLNVHAEGFEFVNENDTSESFQFKIQEASLASRYINRKIDLYSEGLNPILYKEEKGELLPPEENTWYLIYKNADDATEENPQPVDCYLAPKLTARVKTKQQYLLQSENAQDGVVPEGYWFTISAGYAGVDVSIDGRIVRLGERQVLSSWHFVALQFYVPANSQKMTVKIVEEVDYYDGQGGYLYTNTYTIETIYNVDKIEILSNLEHYPAYKSADTSDNELPKKSVYNSNYSFDRDISTTQILNTIDSIDRTDSKLVRIFELPYNPVNIEVDTDGNLVFADNWNYDSALGIMKLTDLNMKFEHEIETSVENPFTPVLGDLNIGSTTGSETRKIKDSKLFHSDYYQPKFIYDSFGFVFQLEKMKHKIYSDNYFKFEFVMTTTIRSRFLFGFKDYELVHSTEDYDNILVVGRNNESVLYSSPYLTYLRTGYNIDVKAKERTERTAIIGGILQGVGKIMDIATLGGVKKVSSRVEQGYSSGATLASTIVNTINTIAESEESMERKLSTLKAQAVGVEGSDDIDLLGYYANNRAKYAIYKVSERLEKELDNLFYYTGYISNEMKIPNTGTRYWFNFVSAEIVFSNLMGNISDICLQEIKNLWKEGVVFLHEHSGNYDFEQVKENWETFLVNL